MRQDSLTFEELIESVKTKTLDTYYTFTLDLSVARDNILFPIAGGLIQVINETSRDLDATCQVSLDSQDKKVPFYLGTRLVSPFTKLWFTNTAQAGKRFTFAIGTEHKNIFDFSFFLTAPDPEEVLTGFILLWNGLIANIPAGWQLCNGTNGTPDLRDKFVVGAQADITGVAKTCVTGVYTQVGGCNTHYHTGTIAVTAHAAHTHVFGTIAVADHAAHTHLVSGNTGNCVTCVSILCGSATCILLNPYSHIHPVSITSGNPSATLTHTVSGATGNPSASLTHVGTVTIAYCPTLPPYFAVAYIQKM